jgi:hypothetical protein
MKKQTHSTTPDLIAQDCIAVRMRLLNRVVTKIYDDALRPLGIKTSQLNILVVTARPRAQQFRLSTPGRQLLEKAKPAWEMAQEEVKDLLGRAGVIALVRAAEKVIAHA